jgi:long-chain acyl-CoA synthetase
MTSSIRQLLEQRAASDPGRFWLITPGGDASLSFGELLADSRRLAAFLHRRGLRSGAHVAWLLPNGPLAVRLLVGTMAAGYVATPLSLLAQAAQLAQVIEDSNCRLLIAGPAEAGRAVLALQRVSRHVDLLVLDNSVPTTFPADQAWPLPDPGVAAPALLMYTSGTTGRPKGVVLNHRNLLAGARFVSEAHALGEADRVLAVLPLYHINAQVVTVLAPLWHGGSLVLPDRFSVSAFWRLAADYRCTWLNVVPTMIAYLLAEPEPAVPPTQVRFCRSASAPLPVEHLHAFQERFGIGIIETMGLTETAAPVFTNPLAAELRKPGSAGQAWGCEARAVDPLSGAVLADGVAGEIQVRGENVMSAYYENPEETARAFSADGWLRTGDLGYRDADGFWFVTGRIKELIIKGGENIAPREIDEVLLAHPDVLEAAATGIPDPLYGQEIVAGIVLHPDRDWDESDLREFCRQRLGSFKTPSRFLRYEALPKGPSGKVQRLRIAEAI